MLISNKNKFIFIHVYKNAGSSIVTALRDTIQPKYQSKINRGMKKINLPTLFYDCQPYDSHIRSSELIEKMSKEEFGTYFSFGIVRNPWDWQVSLYKYTLKNVKHHQHDLVKNLGSFENYIKWRCDGHVTYQKEFLYSKKGKLLVDFVGKFENLNEDFKSICDEIGVSADLPKVNVSNTKPYESFYSDETYDLVKENFQTDIETFGYQRLS